MDGAGGHLQTRSGPVALLVDGDNLGVALAGQMICAAAQLGRITIKRVYLAPAALTGWAGAEGFRFVHSGTGKNAADMALCIDAVEMACRDPGLSFAIASSDRDLAPLALFLVERGHAVLGLGDDRAPGHFRKSCTRFLLLGQPRPAPAPV